MVDLIRESGLLLVLLVLPITILADNLLGAAKADLDYKDHFNKDLLVRGLKKGALVYAGILLYAGVSYLMQELSVNIGGEIYTLIDAMYVIVFAATVKFVKDGIEKLIEITKYKTKEEEE